MMKNNRNYVFFVFFVCSFSFFISCSSSEEGVEIPPATNPVDLMAIPGRYVGSFDNITFSSQGPLSMIVREITTTTFEVRLYETRNFVPMFNADGVTPEALGTITVEGIEASIDLDLRTDSPNCFGDYIGDGSRSASGIFVFGMTQTEECNGEEFFSISEWTFEKTSNDTSLP